jgi:hypothetical protein
MAMEDELRRALRAEDPGVAFTQRVLARAREERTHATRETDASNEPHEGKDAAAAAARGIGRRDSAAVEARTPEAALSASSASASRGDARASGSPRMMSRWLMAIAASIALAATGVQFVQHQRYLAEGERARAQVLTALRLTSEKLNRVHDAINDPAHR